jgi:hypothetical protein
VLDREALSQKSDRVIHQLEDHVRRGERLCIIKAPPGSGKTFALLRGVVAALGRRGRVAIATQTNAQADDVCRRLLHDFPEKVERVWRFASSGRRPPDDLDRRIQWTTQTNSLPSSECVVVATTAKWGLVNLGAPFDVLFVDEAWQMAWSDCMMLQQVASCFVLIGDPGQIPPVVSIPVHRWETSPRAPHRPAPEIILAERELKMLALELPCCRRLPADSVELVRPFYDFDFEPWARPGERFVRPGAFAKRAPIDRILDRLSSSSAVIATLPTPPGGPPLEEDEEAARLAAEIASRLLERGARVAADDDGRTSRLKPADIGIGATHRAMNSALLRALPAGLRDQASGVRVDTPERWQGLERKVMIVIHPLSGVVRPSPFDLETGRLCVMASRHRSGLVVVSRDHVPTTLEGYFPSAEQAVGRPDVAGRGHLQNLGFWQAVAERHAVIGAG